MSESIKWPFEPLQTNVHFAEFRNKRRDADFRCGCEAALADFTKRLFDSIALPTYMGDRIGCSIRRLILFFVDRDESF